MAEQYVKSNFDWSELGPKTRKAIYKAISETMPLVEETAKSLVSVDTGDLKESITSGTKEKPDGVIGWVKTRHVKYALSVEYGHGSYKPHPFLRPAVEKHKEDIVNKFEADL